MIARKGTATLSMNILKPSARNRDAAEKVKLCGATWEFTASLSRDRDLPDMMIGIRTAGQADSTIWEYKVASHFEIPNAKFPEKAFNRKYDMVFNSEMKSFELPLSRPLKEYLDAKNGYSNKQKVLILAHLTVERLQGVPPSDVVKFWEPRGCLADGVLVVQGKRLYVCKRALASHSEFFKDLFFGPPTSDSSSSRKGKKEEVIEGVELKKFNDFLNLAHNCGFPITPQNVENLLEMSKRFGCDAMMRRCGEKIAVSRMMFSEQFKYAERYELTELQEHLYETFKTKTPSVARMIIDSLPADHVSARTLKRLAYLATHIGT